jgi:hypothetical protein
MSLPCIWPATRAIICCVWNPAVARQKAANEVGILRCGFLALIERKRGMLLWRLKSATCYARSN